MHACVAYLFTGTFPLEFAISLIRVKIFSRDWIGDRQTAWELWRTVINSVAQNCEHTTLDLKARMEKIPCFPSAHSICQKF